LSELADRRFLEAQSVWIFPNLFFQTTPMESFLWHCLPNGRDPDSCLLTMYVLTAPRPGEARKPVEREFYTDWEHVEGLTLRQDWENLYRLQRGLHQRGFEGSVLAEIQEMGCRNFNEAVDRYLSEDVPDSIG
jgi:hypothetical protein